MIKELSIRTQILGLFFIFVLVFQATTVTIAISNLDTLGQRTQELTFSTLKEDAITNVQTSAEDTGQVIERKLAKAVSVINALGQAVEDLMSPDFNFATQTSYLDYNSSTLPSDTTYDSRYNTSISKTHSTFYYPGSHPDNLTDGSITEVMGEQINRTSNLDTLFVELWENNPDFAWMYVGFHTTGLFRIFPGSVVDNTRTYDPRVRPWYTAALGQNGDLTFTNPYLDALGQGWMISISKAVYDDNNNILGVVSGDLTLGTIQDIVLDVNILTTGYATLIQNDGTVLAHPSWTGEDSTTNIREVERDGEQTAIPDLTLVELTSSVSGVTEISKDGKIYFYAHTPVLEEFSLIVILSQDEAFESVRGIGEEISAQQSTAETITFVISLMVIIIVLAVGLILANQITKPVDKLSKVARKISSNITGSDIFEGVDIDESLSGDDEVGELTRSFTHMVESLRNQKKQY